jgi:VanZ family protein
MFTAYERSAYGELAGGFWIPMLLLLILRDRTNTASVWRRAFDGSTVPLTLVLAGAWLSNAPLGVMASYLLAGVALVASLQRRSWAPLLRATVAASLGLGLAAIYLVPAAIEQRWVEISQATEDLGEKIENSWLFARHANRALELHDVELLKVSGIAAIMIAVTLIGIFVSWRRKTLPGRRAWWIPLAVIPVAVLLLQFPLSRPVWSTLPKLRFLQFPWRWLVAVEAPMGIFFASAVWVTRSRLRIAVIAVCSVFFVGVGAFSSFVFFQFCDSEDSVRGMLDAYRSGKGFEGVDEYAPAGADNSLVATGLPDACFTSNPKVVLGSASEELTPAYSDLGTCETAFSRAGKPPEMWPEHLRFAGITSHAGYFVLKLRSYPAWQVKVNGSAVHSLPERDDGLMAVPVPQGPVNLTVDWTTTSDVVLGRWLSLLALALVAGLCMVERKLRTTANEPPKARLS